MHVALKRRGVKGEHCVKSPDTAVKETRENQTPSKKPQTSQSKRTNNIIKHRQTII